MPAREEDGLKEAGPEPRGRRASKEGSRGAEQTPESPEPRKEEPGGGQRERESKTGRFGSSRRREPGDAVRRAHVPAQAFSSLRRMLPFVLRAGVSQECFRALCLERQFPPELLRHHPGQVSNECRAPSPRAAAPVGNTSTSSSSDGACLWLS